MKVMEINLVEKKKVMKVKVMDKGLIQVYDCNIHVCDELTFLTLIELILVFCPKLLNQSGMFNYLSEILLNDAWSYERIKNVPSNNNSCAAYKPDVCVIIDYLFVGMNIT